MCFAARVPHGGFRTRSATRAGVVALILTIATTATACGSSPAAGSGAAGTTPVASGPPLPSAGCAAQPGPAVTEASRTVVVGGLQRSYLLTTPAPGTPGPAVEGRRTPAGPAFASAVARPLVLDFHGLGEGASIHAKTTQFGSLGQKEGFVVAFPDGMGTPARWDTSATSSPNPDLAFVTALLAQLESTMCIDTSRVYASGLSDGAFMVSLLACTMSTTFAAIGAVSGLVVPTPCKPARPMPIITFHGTADPILYFNGGIGTATLNHLFGNGPAPPSTTLPPAKLNGTGVPATVATWAEKDRCGHDFTDTRIGSQVVLRIYSCPSDTAIDFYIVLGGGHAWPGSAFSKSTSSVTGFTTFQVDATARLWSFFRRFQL